ncbi:MAG: hypothetical protein ACI4F7_05025 [Acutalibacteraceae bacterium]
MKMQESVLRRVRMIEEKNGIKYAKTDGKLYKTLRVLYTLVFIYTMGINLMFVAGMLLVYGGTDKISGVLNSLISVSVCTVLILAGYILSFFRFKLTAGIMSVAPEIFLIPVFGSVMRDDLGVLGFTASFYWRHLIPLVGLVILMTAATVIAVRARVRTERLYKKVTDNLYKIYQSNGTDVTDEVWEQFLKEYDPMDYKKLFKESERKAADE